MESLGKILAEFRQISFSLTYLELKRNLLDVYLFEIFVTMTLTFEL